MRRAPLAVRVARRVGRRVSGLYPRHGAAPPIEDIHQFVDDAIEDGWQESGRAGLWRAMATLVLDVARTRLGRTRFGLPSGVPPATTSQRRTFMDSFLADIRHAWRRLRRTPTFTTVALLTLALGIGLTTAVYTVVDQSMLRPFSYPDIDRLVLLNERFESQQMSVSWPNFVDWKAEATSFDALGIYRGAAVTLTGGEQPERVNGAAVTSAVFDATGIQPLLGRRFGAADDLVGAPRVAVLSERLWRSQFGATPDVVGRTLTLNSQPYTVVGVVPAAMRFPSRLTDIWLSFGPVIPTLPTARDNHPGLAVIGRLAPGVSVGAASTEMEVIARRLEAAHPGTNARTHVVLRSYREVIVQDVRPAFDVLLGAAALVLLMACANLAGLMLARADARREEIAVRAALGADRLRLLRHLLAESVLLATTGGALGVGIAWASIRAFIASRPTSVPRIDLIGVDWRVVAFAVGLSMATGLLFGSVPALRATAAGLRHTVRAGRQDVGGRSGLRRTLVVAEVAIAFVLLVGAGLFGRSLAGMLAIDLGFTPAHIVSMQVALPPAAYPTLDAWQAFHQRLLDSLGGTGGPVAIASDLPLSGAAESSIIREGDPRPTPEHPPAEAAYTVVSPGYFDMMGIQVLRGRVFTTHDTAASLPVIVLDDEAVARLFRNGDALGRRVSFESRGETPETFAPIWREVVGIVHHVRQYGLTGEPPYVEAFTPVTQLPIWMTDRRPVMSLLVRTRGEVDATVAGVRRAVRAIDPNLPVYDAAPLEAALDGATEQPRLSLLLVGAFALLALVLATVGVYGVLAQNVEERTREIGVRMALGARRGQVSGLIARQAARLVAVGLALGGLGALGFSRLVRSMLYGISPTDPLTLTSVALLLLATAAVAAAIPARRAAAVDPLRALRQD